MNGLVAQRIERLSDKQKVEGSNPSQAIFFLYQKIIV